MIELLRFLTRGKSTPRMLTLRLAGLVAMAIVVYIFLSDTGVVQVGNPAGGFLPTQAAVRSAGEIRLGEAVSGTVRPGERDGWIFRSERGQRVNIRVRSEWDSYLEVIPANGTQAVAVDANSGGQYQPFICNYRLGAAGAYQIVVSDFLGLPTPAAGDYELLVEAATHEDTRPIQAGETVDGVVDSCDGDFYLVNVKAGERLEVVVTVEGESPLYARLLNERGSDDTLAFSTTNPANDGIVTDTFSVEILADGALIIQVGAPLDSDPIAYRLTVNQ